MGSVGCVPGAGFEPACARFKGRPGCRQPTPGREPPFGADLNRPPYRSGPQPCAAAKLPPGAGLEPCISAEDPSRPCVPGGPCARPGLNRDAPRGALAPRASASAFPPRAHESRDPVPTRIIRRTKAEPQAVRGGMATLPGFEPGTSATRARRCCRVELEGTE
jgi:hypothetical protein